MSLSREDLNEIEEKVTTTISKKLTEFENLADKGLAAWQKKSYSGWIMLAVVVVLPLIGVVVGFNLER